MSRAYHPGIGQAVMACRCGRGLGLSDMYYLIPLRPTAVDSLTVPRVACFPCVVAQHDLLDVPEIDFDYEGIAS